ncbi:MAG: TetR/AcrR family transcriptional regulator [Ilumatobacteraceae bacterium]
MGRPRIAALDDVVIAAMAAFREHGYAATSVRDLETATGLKAASLYQAFGSKAGLYEAALARYHLAVVERRITEHLQPEFGLDGIRSFFSSTYTTEPEPTHGCLVANGAVEFASISASAQQQVNAGLRQIRDAFAVHLSALHAAGELGSIDIDATADALLVLYEGMLVMLRTADSLCVDLDRTINGVLRLIAPTGAQ